MSAPLSRRAALTGAAAVVPVALASQCEAPAYADVSSDAELIALCAEIEVLEHRINAFYDGPDALADEDEADALRDPLAEHQEELIDRICAMRATTPAGFAARVRALLAWAPDYANHVASLSYDEKMVGALLRDLTAVAS